MSAYQSQPGNSSTTSSQLNLEADVLVIGGGPSATWAAWSAAAQGAKVVLVDKGYCGTSGATAPSGTGVWYVPPDPQQREAAMASREALGGFFLSVLGCSGYWIRHTPTSTNFQIGVILFPWIAKVVHTGDRSSKLMIICA